MKKAFTFNPVQTYYFDQVYSYSKELVAKAGRSFLNFLILSGILISSVFAQSQTFTYSGSIQTFTVPVGVFSLTVDARGAQGGSSSGQPGGLGARMLGVVSVTPGQSIQILVGQQGFAGTSGGGGGGSFVVAPGNVPLVVAGGGGGGYYSSYSAGSVNMAGSIGTSGMNGYHGMNGTIEGLGGINGNGGASGNTYTADGSGGGGFFTNGGNGSPSQGGLAFINGGAGGIGGGSGGRGGFGGGGGGDWSSWTGGGGGGGYSGGGGGVYYGLGGGGGSFISGTTTTATAGFQSGNGQIVLSWVVVSNCSGTPAAGTIAVNNSTQVTTCSGAGLNFTSTGTSNNTGISYQWQVGPSSTGPWTNISGATSTSFTTTSSTSQWYSLSSTCSFSGLSARSNAVELIVSNIASPTASGATINCGVTTTLTATGSTGTYAWYTASTGGTLLGTSASFTTPVLTGTTTYFVEAQSGVSTLTSTFGFTGGAQTFTVPNGVFQITLDARGAQGGGGTMGTGGLGGRVQSTLSVTPGQVLNIYVGGTTTSITGGYNGGGNAVNSSNARGGGGATDIRIGGTALTDRVIVAAGGGGAGTNCGNGNHGGNGGGLTGAAGWQCSTQTTYVGLGGTQSAGGAFGNNQGQGCGTNGALGIGGTGACTYGGGGGGGYYGGGGGGYGGGGGGSSWTTTTGTSNITNTSGTQSGNGQLIITYTQVSCSSARTPVVVTVNPITAPTGTGTTSTCNATANISVSGSTGTYAWYTTSTGGTSISTSPNFTTPTLFVTTTYFVEATSGICASARVPVVVTIPSITSPTASGTSITCGTSATLTASGSNGVYAWYAIPVGGTAIGTSSVLVTPSLFATTTYYVEAVNGLCPSPRTSVVVTVNPLSSPTSQNVDLCGTGSVTLTASGSTGSYNWYTTSTGGTPVSTSPSYTTPSLNSTTTYWVESRGAANVGNQTFSFTGGVQTFTVPAGVTQLTVDARGASGGGGTMGNAGLGGRTQAVISVTPGQVLNIYVGGTTTTITGGYNGGGSAVNSTNARGGGGATDIRIGGTALSNRVLVAAGGGGAGTNCGNGNHGGNGGGLTGADGWQCSTQTSYVGLGGTQTAGGVLGNNLGQGCGTNGVLGVGGTGACTYGGGGGGGYFGGGGGGYGGGGGGSSFVTSSGSSSIVHTAGVNTGNGQITINWTGLSCTSNRIPVTVVSNCVLVPGTATVNNLNSISICANTNFSLNTAGTTIGNGVTYQWQGASTNTGPWTNISGGTTRPFVTSSSTNIWYRMIATVTQTGQIDSTNAIGVVIAPLTPPTANGTTVICGSTPTLFASGSTGSYEWYTASTGGSPVATTPSFTTPNLTVNTTYFVEAFVGSCRSVRTAVPITVTPVSSPSAAPATINCGASTSLVATGSTGTYAWFAASTGGTALSTSPSFTTPLLTTTTTYFVEALSGVISGAQTLTFTGGMQTFTVPSGVFSINVDARGAAGGTATSGTGGLGGRVQATLAVTPGQVLNIFVGGTTTSTTGGYNGGGSASNFNMRGGGGATDIRTGGTALANRILVAAGGGGAGSNCGSNDHGGNGGGLTGADGWQCNSQTSYVGLGGTQSAGGLLGNNLGQGCATNGSLGIGGNGACNNGGGGGGGYFGGGGGGYGGGGGGSSFVTSTGSSAITHTAGANTGNGQIVISYSVTLCSSSSRTPVVVTVTPIADPVANGATINCGVNTTLTATGSTGSYAWYAASTGGTPLALTASYTTPNLSATTTYFVDANSGSAGCTQRGLSSLLTNITTNTTAIQSSIPSPYNFTMDGSGGNNGNSISDGGNDMYDGGNFINTNLQSNIFYSDNVILSSSAFGSGGQYVTRKMNGIWVLAANMNGVSTFSITGNNGADGGGLVSATNFNVTVGCQTYTVFLKRVYNAGDPSINQMVIIPQSTTAGHTWDTNTDNSLHTISGLSSTTRLYYLLYAGSGGLFIDNTQAQTIATTFLNQAGAGELQTATCASNRIPVVVNVTPISSPTASGTTTTCNSTAALTVSGSTGSYAWFTVSTGGTAVSTSPNYTTPTLFVTTTYFVASTSGICSSPRVPVVVTIPSIASPTANSTSITCGNTTTLTASGSNGSYAWYSIPVGGTAIGTSPTYTTPALLTTTTYYVEAVNGLCPSPRTLVVVTSLPLTTPVSQDAVLCGSGSVTLTASGSTGSYNWYTTSTGGTPISTTPSYTTPTLNSTTSYFVESRGALNAGTQTFSFSGNVQTFTVPAGVTQLVVDARGASGGTATSGNGGLGGRVQATIAVTPGQVLNLYIGGTTTTATGGYNGGGNATSTNLRGGGGATDIRIGGTSLADRVLVAAGGGGAGSNCGSNDHGGNGGGLTGASGWQCNTQTSWVGLGGTQTAGGLLGNNQGQGCATNGSLGLGGNGACSFGGGGGGGYFGGGGGGYGGGGGGSSFVTSTGSSAITHTAGTNTGNGQLVLTWSGTGCLSNRLPVTVISNCILTPGVANVNGNNMLSICASTNFTLGTTGTTLGNGISYQWQSSQTNNGPWANISGGTTLPFVTSATQTRWYRMLATVIQTGAVDSTNVIEVVIAPLTPPTAPGTSILCGANSTLTASGSSGSYEWYTNATGGSPIGTNLTYTTPNLSVSTTYHVEAFIGSCRSVRTPVTVIVNPVPSPNTSSGATINCGSTTTLTVSGSSGNYAWYTVSTGGTAINTTSSFTTPLLTASTTYFVEAISGTSGGTSTLSFTGSIQTFTVPAGVTSITIDARGAQGGTSGTNLGGLGARMTGTFAVTPGQVLQILVGGQGGTGSQQGGGGGGTFVVASGNTPLVVAGGGGGGFFSSFSIGASTNMAGTTGTAGMAGYNGNNSVVAGLGGTNGSGGLTSTSYPTGGGSGGGGFTGNGVNGNASTGGLAYVNGGTAGLGAGNPSGGHGGYGGGGGADWANWTGGGGGGGYSGGGAGVYYGCGGGGGSFNSGSSQANTAGFQAGNGQVIISWSGISCTSTRIPVPVNVTPLSAPSSLSTSISCGSTTTLIASGSTGSYEWFATDTGSTVLSSSPTYTTPNLTVTTTYFVRATTGTQGCLPNSLSTILSNMTTNTNAIQGVIPSPYNFTMDGSGGNNGNSINDGGNDMYDGGNFINTNIQSNIFYSDNVIVNSSAFGSGGQYVTRKMNGIWALAANMNGVSTFSITGNNGADGGGSVSSTNFNVTIGCQTFTVFLKRVFNAGDPSINQMVIIPQSSTAGHTWDTNTDNSLHTISGLSGTTRLYYLLYAGTSGLFINDTQAQTIATTFLNQIVATQAPLPFCSSTRVPVVVSVPIIQTPTASPSTLICGNTTTLTASGSTGTYGWFLSSTGGSAVGTNPTYTTPTLNASTTYFVEAVSGICRSTRVAVPVTVNPLPNPNANSVVLCGAGSTTLAASGSSGTYRWYTTSTGGTPIGTTPSYTTPFLSSTTTYYVEAMGQLNSGTQTFNFTGGAQTFTVPAGVTQITVDARGASGGGGTMGTGGLGGRAQAILNVTPGQVLNLYVGGTTTTITGGYNGGGSAINSTNARGGGGASDIRLGGTTLSERVLVAAGGGGAGTNCGNNNAGGNAGGLTGADGWQCGSQSSWVGFGGTQTAGGLLGNNQGQGCGTNGALGIGGTGACTYGGGGGGGYFGGGGGGYGGGGGGSSFVTSVGSSSVAHTSGFNTGNGQIILSWSGQPCLSARLPVIVHVVTAPATPAPSSNSPICNGDTLRLTTQTVINGDYLWTGPNGFSSTQQNPNLPGATNSNVGNYTVSVAIMGCPAPTRSTNVVVNDSVLSISRGGNTPLCSGENLLLTGSIGPNNAVYSWTGPNGFTSSVQNNTISSIQTIAQGQYTYSITSPGCNTLTDTLNVQIIPSIIATVSSNSPVCQGDGLYLNTSYVLGSPYIWTGPNGFSSTQQAPSISQATPFNTGVYTLTIQQPGCNPLNYFASVVVSGTINNVVVSSNSPTCTGSTLTLSANGNTGANYFWSGPLGFTSSNQNVTLTNVDTTHAGQYTLMVTNTGCSNQTRIVNVVVYPTLTVSVGSNSPVCQGNRLSLSSSTHLAASYQWTGPNGFQSSIQNPAISNTQLSGAGNYTLIVNQLGCGTVSHVVPVVIGPTINTSNAGSNSPVCSGSQLLFTATNILGASYSWTGPNGYTANQFMHAIPNPGTVNSGMYSVTLSSPGCNNYSLMIPVTVYPTTILTANSNSPVCQGGLLNLTGSFIQDAVYTWYGPSGYQSSNRVPSLTNAQVTNSGVYTIVATQPSCGTQSATVSVVVSPSTLSTQLGSNTPVCTGSSLILSATAYTGATYFWTGPAGFTASGANPAAILPASAGNSGIYTLVVSSPGCVSTTLLTSAIVHPPLVFSATSNSPVCAGSAIYLSASDHPSATYSWSGPSGFASISRIPSITTATVSNSGIYTVVVTQPGCGTATQTVSVTVGPNIQNLVSGSNSPVCSGSSLFLSAANVSGVGYSWSGPGGFTSTATSPSIPSASPLNSGMYTLTLTSSGCGTIVHSVPVSVNAPISLTAGVLVSPLCEGSVLSLTSTSILNGIYSWSGPNGFLSSQANPSIVNVTQSQSGVYTLTAIQPGCGSFSTNASVIVGSSIANINGGSNSPVCVGGTLNLTSVSRSGLNYLWTGPGGFTSTLSNVTFSNITTGVAGNYSLSVSSPGCGSIGYLVKVVVNNPVGMSASNNTPICSGNTVSLIATGAPRATYSWSGPNSFSTSIQNPNISNAQAVVSGVYTVIINDPTCGPVQFTTQVQVGANLNVATPSSNSPVCVNGTLTLSSTTISGATYSWSGPNGFTSSSQNPIISPVTTSEAGEYTLTVGTNGCIPITRTTTLVVNPALVATPGSNSPVCQGNVAFMSCNVLSGATYLWTGPNGYSSSLANPSLINAQPVSTGIYTLTINSSSCGVVSGTTSMLVGGQISNVALNSNGPVCTGNQLNLSSTLVSSGAIIWSAPDGFTSNLQNPTRPGVLNNGGGVYTYSVNSPGCGSITRTLSVVVNQAPVLSAGSNSPVCQGNAISLTVNSILGSTYTWSGPNSFQSTVQNPSISNAQPIRTGVYTLSVTNNSCGTTTTSTSVVVNGNLSGLSAISNTPVCAGNNLSLSITNRSGFTFVWSGPNGFTSTNANAVVANANSGNAGRYTVIVSSAGCGSSTVSTNTVVVNNPISVVASGTSPVCVGQNIFFTGVAPTGSTYSWSGPSGFAFTTPNPSRSNAQLSHAGVYTLNATVPGCGLVSTTATVIVNVCRESQTTQVKNLVSEGVSESYEDATISGSQSDNLSHATLTAWPNPNQGNSVNLKWEGLSIDDGEITVRIYDAIGKSVLLKTLNKGNAVTFETNLDFWKLLSSGVYTIESAHNGTTLYQKLVVR